MKLEKGFDIFISYIPQPRVDDLLFSYNLNTLK